MPTSLLGQTDQEKKGEREKNHRRHLPLCACNRAAGDRPCPLYDAEKKSQRPRGSPHGLFFNFSASCSFVGRMLCQREIDQEVRFWFHAIVRTLSPTAILPRVQKNPRGIKGMRYGDFFYSRQTCAGQRRNEMGCKRGRCGVSFFFSNLKAPTAIVSVLFVDSNKRTNEGKKRTNAHRSPHGRAVSPLWPP